MMPSAVILRPLEIRYKIATTIDRAPKTTGKGGRGQGGWVILRNFEVNRNERHTRTIKRIIYVT